MTENGAWNEGCLTKETVNESRHVGLRIETETVHTGVEFDVDWEVCDALFFGCMDELFEDIETEYLWFEAVVKEHLEGCGLWVHYHDVGGDASLAEIGTFICHSYSKIVNAIVLESLACFERTDSIAACLDHAYHLGFGFHEVAVIANIVDECVEVNFEDGLMNFEGEEIADLVETIAASTLDEYKFVFETMKNITIDELFGGME